MAHNNDKEIKRIQDDLRSLTRAKAPKDFLSKVKQRIKEEDKKAAGKDRFKHIIFMIYKPVSVFCVLVVVFITARYLLLDIGKSATKSIPGYGSAEEEYTVMADEAPPVPEMKKRAAMPIAVKKYDAEIAQRKKAPAKKKAAEAVYEKKPDMVIAFAGRLHKIEAFSSAVKSSSAAGGAAAEKSAAMEEAAESFAAEETADDAAEDMGTELEGPPADTIGSGQYVGRKNTAVQLTNIIINLNGKITKTVPPKENAVGYMYFYIPSINYTKLITALSRVDQLVYPSGKPVSFTKKDIFIKFTLPN
ncbi:hypothetical protein ACFL6D_04990 [Spirochaetota bacterium]